MAYEPLFDFLKRKPKEDESQESADIQSRSNERALLAGATPLLVGLLTGNTGTGAEIASKALLQEDERAYKQQNSLLEAMKKKNKESTTGNRATKILNPDGSITYVRESDAIGKNAPLDRRPYDELIDLAK